MPHHVHLLLAVGRGSVVDFVAQWKSLCCRLRRLRGGNGRFWQRSLWDHGLRTTEDVHAAVTYILENPVRAGLVRNRREYPLNGSMVWDSL
jgi:REP element-mobilizing transposase RayT